MKKKFVFKPIYYGYIGYAVTMIILLCSRFWMPLAYVACSLLIISSAYCCIAIYINYFKEKKEVEEMIAHIAYLKTMENNGVNSGEELPVSKDTYNETKKFKRRLLSPLILHACIFFYILSNFLYLILA